MIFLIGIGVYWLAPRVGPNPLFGVRGGHAYANRAARISFHFHFFCG
ncbi:MAG: hypothetical protein HY327_07330 [Chloroflexi bacterium]|nr:hypothetical protein [Chloroflexota bacterium]